MITPQLLNNLAFKHLPVAFLRRRLAGTTVAVGSSFNTERQLLIDVSVIAKADAGTGIQRVVRNLYQELLAASPAGCRVCPVAATRRQGYCYLPTDFLRESAKSSATIPAISPVKTRAGDLFLGLDLAAHIVPHRLGELLRWKQQGVGMCFFVYDLLPVLKPAWFTSKTTQNFRRWLRAMAILADKIIAISDTVKTDFTEWLQDTYGLGKESLPCAVIQLGAELNATQGNQTTAGQSDLLPLQLTDQKFILMVGTIEPRKGHADALDAFEHIWAMGDRTNLVIAGRQGWKVQPFMQRLHSHPEAGVRLHWLDSPSDEMLLSLYQQCSGLLMASKGEGFGLPIIEAACFNKPLLVRDLPVFREVVGNNVTFFPSSPSTQLLEVLTEWLKTLASGKNVSGSSVNCTSWKESCSELLKILSKTFYSDRSYGDKSMRQTPVLDSESIEYKLCLK